MIRWGLVRIVVLFVLLMLAASTAFAQEQTYTIQPGDTLQRVANSFGVSLDAILIRNNIVDPNRVRVGETIIIPSGTVDYPGTHTVQPGERLIDIALRYNTTVDAILTANNLFNANFIQPGQVLVLPTFGSQLPAPSQPATTQPTTTQPTTTQPTVSQPTTTQPTTTTATQGTYMVQIGDTLASIARRFGTTWQAIAALNNLPNPNYVQAGMTLRIPAATTQPQPPAPQPTFRTYIVRPGDMLSELAVRFNVSVQAIAHANGITNYRHIYPGQVLRIPPAGTGTPPIVSQPVPQHPIGNRYIVQPGDTMLRIARYLGVDVFNLARANQIFNLNQIFAGQSLIIPGR